MGCISHQCHLAFVTDYCFAFDDDDLRLNHCTHFQVIQVSHFIYWQDNVSSVFTSLLKLQ